MSSTLCVAYHTPCGVSPLCGLGLRPLLAFRRAAAERSSLAHLQTSLQMCFARSSFAKRTHIIRASRGISSIPSGWHIITALPCISSALRVVYPYILLIRRTNNNHDTSISNNMPPWKYSQDPLPKSPFRSLHLHPRKPTIPLYFQMSRS